MSVVVWRNRTLDGQAVEHLELIAARLQHGSFSLAGGEWNFSLRPVSGRLAPPGDSFLISMEWGGGQLHLLSARRASLALLYAHQFPDAALDVLPEELALAGFGLAWRELTARLEQSSGRRVRLVRAASGDIRALDTAPFRFLFTLDSDRARDGVQGVLAADGPGLALLALLARRLPAESAIRDPQTPMPLLLEIGETSLTVAACRTLGLHDVVFPDTIVDLTSPTVWLRADAHHAARARLDGQSLVIESILEKSGVMSNPPAPPPSDDAQGLARLDDVEVRVSFDLGQKVLRLGELAAMQPGQVIGLDVPPSRMISIRANGRLIGRGELVRVSDQVGVRILELAPAQPEEGQEP